MDITPQQQNDLEWILNTYDGLSNKFNELGDIVYQLTEILNELVTLNHDSLDSTTLKKFATIKDCIAHFNLEWIKDPAQKTLTNPPSD